MGLLQSLVALAALVAGFGISTGLIRFGAAALAKEDSVRVVALRQAAWLLLAIMGALATLALTLFRAPISQWMLGGAEHAESVMLMTLALLFTLTATVESGMLNAYHRVKALAQIGVVTSVLGTASALTLIALWREAGVPYAVIATAAINCLVAGYFLRREAPAGAVRASRRATLDAARSLLRFGAPYTLSMLVGTGIQLVLPALVLANLGRDHVGYYRAATALSVTYLGFLLAAMAQDYYPRLSAVSRQPSALISLVNQQHRLVMLLGVPMILGTLALVPYLIPLVYSTRFSPAVAVLEWQLIGDLFKFSSWTMAYVILARSGGLTYFLTELIGGVTTLGATWLGMQWFGLAGLHRGFLGTYVVYYFVVWLVVRGDIGMVWSQESEHGGGGGVVVALAAATLTLAAAAVWWRRLMI